MHINENRWPNLSLLLFSLLLGLYLFFLNPLLTAAFESSDSNIEWYAVFSKNIFHPTTSYIAESILLPFFAKLIGASASTASYRVLCALITISILPLLAAASHRFFNSTSKAFIFVVLFGVSFTYLANYRLGFPDPLTIALLCFTALQRQPLALFLGAFLAGLSHFSMSLISLSALSLLIIALPTLTKDTKLKTLKAVWLGLLVSRLLLALWFYLFEYKLTSRVDVVLDGGLTLFINHHKQSLSVFWLTPGLIFLLSYFLISSYFIFKKRALFALALGGALCLAYIAHFLTVDGLRVFAVVISSTYVLMLATCIDSFYPTIEPFIQRGSQRLTHAFKELQSQTVYFGLGFPLAAAWLFFIGAAANKGFFINEVPFIHSRLFDVRVLDYVLMAGALFISATTITPKLRNTVPLAIATKIIFFSPLFIIGVQYLRQLLSPNTPLPLWLKVTLFALALCLAAMSAKIKVGKLLALANQKLLDRPASPN